MVVGARKAGAKMRGARSDHEVMSSDRVTHHRVTLIARGNDCLLRYRTAVRENCARHMRVADAQCGGVGVPECAAGAVRR